MRPSGLPPTQPLLFGFWFSFCTATLAAPAPECRYAQPAVPEFWKGRVEHVEQAVAAVECGTTRVLTHSPGGRPVHLVTYGDAIDFQRQANYNSAVAARTPYHYARKPPNTPPIVMIIGPCHGQETEGIVGLINLLRVAETGSDLRGRAWPALQANLERSRALLVPLANPDGRARCPYDSWVGIPVEEMTRIGQGTRKDGTLYGWPGAKQRHPMTGDVGLLGAYFNDNGINLMHDEWFEPMAEETRALLAVARDEAPDYILNLHSHGSPAAILSTSYVPRYCKEAQARFAERLMSRYRKAGLPDGRAPEPTEDGADYPPPSFNLTSALHHVCGAVSMTFECPHGVEGPRYPRLTHEQILDVEMILFDELFAFAVQYPRAQSPASDAESK